MLVLHTSDWHLCQELYSHRREEEHQYFFQQLIATVAERRPDVMVVSGDIFHTAAPPATARKMYNEALLALHQAHPEMQIVVIAGNHDSAARLEVDGSLWKYFKVHVVAMVRRTPEGVDLNSHIIHIPNKGYIAAVPHVYPHNLPAAVDDTDRLKAFFTHLLETVAQTNTDHLPVVLMAHLAVTGSDITGHQTAYDATGGMEFVPSDTFNGHYDYVALGHIHRAQDVADNKKIRYCGTPIAVHFDEEYDHSVSLVDVEYGRDPVTEILPIRPLRPLVTMPQEPVDFEQALDILSDYDPESLAYVRLHVNINDGLPADCIERAVKATEGKKCYFCTFKRVDNQVRKRNKSLVDLAPDQLRDMNPVDVARKYLAGKGYGDTEIETMLDMMEETIRLIREEQP